MTCEVEQCGWPGPCCRTGIVPERNRLDAADAYIRLVGHGSMGLPFTLLWAYAPVAVARVLVPPLIATWTLLLRARGRRADANAWRRWVDAITFVCPFVDHHARQSFWWSVACVASAVGGVAVAVTTDWSGVGAALVGASLLALPGGHLLGAARAESGDWAGPPVVHRLLPHPLARWRRMAARQEDAA